MIRRLPIPFRRPASWAAALLLSAALCPAAGAWHVYYANLHSHSELSDGIGTPAEAFTYARDVAGIDVLALTEHSTYMDDADWASLQQTAAAFTQSGVFVALGSQESGNLNHFGHLNIYGSALRNTTPTDNLTANYMFIRSTAGVGCFNHPSYEYGTNFDSLALYPDYRDALGAIEVRNGETSVGYEAQYLTALANGWRVGPFAGQDNHLGHWGDEPCVNMGNKIFLTGILADSLTRDEILEALHERRFYAMEVNPPSDRLELTFTIDGHPMGSEITVGVNPLLVCEARGINGASLFNRVELYRDGELYDSEILIGNQVHYETRDVLSEGERHTYFVRAHQVDSDYCWSAPIWVTAHIDPADTAAGPFPEERAGFRPNPSRMAEPVWWHGGAAFAPSGAGAERTCAVLSLHDAGGRLIRVLRGPAPGAGQRVLWDGRDEAGRTAAPGVYYWRARTGDGTVREGRVLRVR